MVRHTLKILARMDQKFDFLKFDLAGTATFCCLICWQNSAWFDMENILAIPCVLLLSTWISVEFLFLKDLSGKKKKKKKKEKISQLLSQYQFQPETSAWRLIERWKWNYLKYRKLSKPFKVYQNVEAKSNIAYLILLQSLKLTNWAVRYWTK